MRTLACCLCLALPLAAQGAGALSLDLSTHFGADPLAQIQLVPRGCWDGLVLGPATRPRPPANRRVGEATVEVWDLALVPAPRAEAFGLYLGALRERLSRALRVPPPSHGTIELGDFLATDPGSPQKLDLTRVKSMQDRFNRLPPANSPVR